MHRTQIYLQDDIYAQLKYQAQILGVSISELIRRTLEKEFHQGGAHQARAYFNSATPLKSFAETDAESYVDEIRSLSRIIQP